MQHNHQPDDYVCPFCGIATGKYDDYTTASDIVFENETTVAFIGSRWWPNNKGSVLVIPKQHFENVYDIPDDVLAEVYATAKRVATAVRDTYDCQGTSMRQHNEPAGGQDVWHFHVHVFPRNADDELYIRDKESVRPTADERAVFAQKLRAYLEQAT